MSVKHKNGRKSYQEDTSEVSTISYRSTRLYLLRSSVRAVAVKIGRCPYVVVGSPVTNAGCANVGKIVC